MYAAHGLWSISRIKEGDIIIMYNPKEIKHIVLDGHSLTLESFVAVRLNWQIPL